MAKVKKEVAKIGDVEVTITTKKVAEEKGKPVYLVISAAHYGKEIKVMVDHRCLFGEDEEKCDVCRLKFNCFTSEALNVTLEELYPRAEDLTEIPLGVRAKQYIEHNRRPVADK
jgi:hypothetical protein